MRANEKKADINQRSEGKKVAAFSLTFLSTNMFCLLIKSCFLFFFSRLPFSYINVILSHASDHIGLEYIHLQI